MLSLHGCAVSAWLLCFAQISCWISVGPSILLGWKSCPSSAFLSVLAWLASCFCWHWSAFILAALCADWLCCWLVTVFCFPLGIIQGLFPLVIIKGLVLLVSVFSGACWEPVSTGLFCIVVFLASRYFPASLNFLIYILLTFDQKKERALSLSILTMSGPGKFPRVESN